MILEPTEAKGIAGRQRTVLTLFILIIMFILGMACLLIWGQPIIKSLLAPVGQFTKWVFGITTGSQISLWFTIGLLTAISIIWMMVKKSYSFIAWSILSLAIHMVLALMTWKIINEGIITFFLGENGLWYPLNVFIDAVLISLWTLSFLNSFTMKKVNAGMVGQMIVLDSYIHLGRNVKNGPVNTLLPFTGLVDVKTMSAVVISEYMKDKPDKDKKGSGGTGVAIQAGFKDHEFQAIFEIMFSYGISDTRRALLNEAKISILRDIIKTAITTVITDPNGNYKDIDDIRRNKAIIAQKAFKLAGGTFAPGETDLTEGEDDLTPGPSTELDTKIKDHEAKKFEYFGRKLLTLTIIEVESAPAILQGRIDLEAAELREQVEDLNMDRLISRSKKTAEYLKDPHFKEALFANQVEGKTRRGEDTRITGSGARRAIHRNKIGEGVDD